MQIEIEQIVIYCNLLKPTRRKQVILMQSYIFFDKIVFMFDIHLIDNKQSVVFGPKFKATAPKGTFRATATTISKCSYQTFEHPVIVIIKRCFNLHGII